MKFTPRKLQALLKVHLDMKKQEAGQKVERNNNNGFGYIDKIPGW